VTDVRVGIVGYGLAGAHFHAPLIRACNRMDLSAVLTSRDAPEKVESFEGLLDRCDLVVVASPNETHFQIAKEALERGRHVVVDKPFTVAVEQADELISLAQRVGRVLTVFHNRRWDGDYLTVRKILPALGEVFLFETCWDRFRPEIKEGWREVPTPGSGTLSDLGPHMIDQTLQLFGWPDAIFADIQAQRPGARVDDYFDLTLHYGARRACLRCSSLVAQPRPRFAVHGTGGAYVKRGLDQQEGALKAGEDPLRKDFGRDADNGTLTAPDRTTMTVATERGRYLTFYEGVAGAILDGAPVPVDPRDARNGLLLIDLAHRAAELGQLLPVPAANWTEVRAPAGSL
jgi:scyllo-inositol 2-dehydrogenase (NADP+)